ncbi:NACHT domain-containing protein [Nocardia nova]|nr:NACHT domain-containing protein [Nocardia nova]
MTESRRPRSAVRTANVIRNSRITGDVFQQVITQYPPTWQEKLDESANRLASKLKSEIASRLGRLGDRRPDELVVRWRAGDKAGDRPIDLYRSASHGRLIVLGESGAGKSIFLDRLVRDLLRELATTAGPVPVIVNLNSWAPDRVSLSQWIVDRLIFDHPFVEESHAAALLGDERILPVLDGFDEINADLQHQAWEQLNNVGLAMIIASRPDQYREVAESAGPLASATLAELEPLTPGEAAEYLTDDDVADSGLDTWRSELRADPDRLGKALSSPLMVSLARDLYGRNLTSKRFADRDAFPSAAAIEHHLLAAFVPSRYRNDTNSTMRQFGPQWIAGLARSIPEGRTEIAWWELASSVSLPARIVGFGVMAVLVGAVTGALAKGAAGAVAASALLAVLAVGVAVAPVPRVVRTIGLIGRTKYAAALLCSGVIGGICAGLLSKPLVLSVGLWTLPFAAAAGTLPACLVTWGTRRWELGDAAKTVWKEIGLGSGGAWVGGAAVSVVFTFFQVPDPGYAGWVGYCCLVGLAFSIPAAVEGLPGRDISTPHDLLDANRLWAFGQIVSVSVPFGLIASTVTGPVRGILIGVAVGLAWGIAMTAWGRWFVLVRVWMVVRGQLPWFVWRFLEDAHERQILRQKGAVFQFRHGSLQELLAAQGD